MEEEVGPNLGQLLSYVYVSVIILGAVAWIASSGKMPWSKKKNVIFTEKDPRELEEEGTLGPIINWFRTRSKKVLLIVGIILLLGIVLLRVSV